MRLLLPFLPPNLNEVVKADRSNKYKGNQIKRSIADQMRLLFAKEKWDEGYPIRVSFLIHFKDRRQDLDNFNIKAVIDGLRYAGVIENDNLTKITSYHMDAVIDGSEQVEIEIEKI